MIPSHSFGGLFRPITNCGDAVGFHSRPFAQIRGVWDSAYIGGQAEGCMWGTMMIPVETPYYDVSTIGYIYVWL